MIVDWTDLIYIPRTRTGWAILAVFVLPVIGALLLVSAIFWNAGA